MPDQTFAGTVKTPNGSFNPAADRKLPPMAALNVGAMKNATALAGTTGTEVSLVHGQSWYQLQDDVTENILGNYTFTISGSENQNIKVNLIHRVGGTTNDTRVGVHNQTNIAARNDEFMHTRTEIHHQSEHREQKTFDNEIANKVVEFLKEHIKVEWLVVALNPGFDSEFKMTSFEGKMVTTGLTMIHAETTQIECELKELKIALGLVKEQVLATYMKAAAAHLKVIPFSGNAGAAVNADSPLG